MVKWVIVIAIAIAIVIAGLVILIISWDGGPPVTETVSVSINAIPWARVFIKLPQGSDFIEPRVQDFTIAPEPNVRNANVTPIRGSLKVPVRTAIKLVYRGKEKIFPYEVWKDGKTISYDFLGQ